MRLIVDITLWKHNRVMEEALREIMARHDIAAGGDHETYDIAISALPKWRQKFVKVSK